VKYGYSNLLSETIEAVRLEYHDCRTFQLVCPVCREPVYKVVREHPEITHYLSHYPASQAYAADCELRVAAFDPREVEQKNILARGQKLSLYLQVLRETILSRDYPESAREKARTFIKAILRSKTLAYIRHKARLSCARVSEESFRTFARFYVEEVAGKDNPMWRTTFALATQMHIGWDVWRTLCTEQSRENFDYLWAHGYLTMAHRYARARERVEPWVESAVYLEKCMNRLLQLSRDRGMELLEEMSRTRVWVEGDSSAKNALDKLMSHVLNEMVGCLIRLPYFEMLKRT
jgi:hypothetical protein